MGLRQYPVPLAPALAAECWIRYKKRPCFFQQNVGLDCLRRFNVVSVAATGAGKSLSMWLPLLYNNNGILIVISPLNMLEGQQVEQLTTLGISAIAITAATATTETFNTIAKGDYRVILTSPESILEDPRWVTVQNSKVFMSRLDRFIIDEGDCISEWSDFRVAWGRLTALLWLYRGVPFLVTTATAAPAVLRDIHRTFRFDSSVKLHLRSNDRPNLYLAVRPMKYTQTSMQDLAFLVDPAWGSLQDVPVTSRFLCFAGSRTETEKVAKYLRGLASTELRDQIVWFHSGMSDVFRKKHIALMDTYKLLGIVCTDACGRGIDLRTLQLVVHWRAPKSLGPMVQRIGRAGRDPETYAIAIIIPETSSCQPAAPHNKGPRKSKRAAAPVPSTAAQPIKYRAVATPSGAIQKEPIQPEVISSVDADSPWSQDHETDSVHEFLTTCICRRKVLDRYFGNDKLPEEPYCCERCAIRKSPICCDLCHPEFFEDSLHPVPIPEDSRQPKRTKVPDFTESAPNIALRAKLYDWRKVATLKDFGAALPPEALLSDDLVDKIVALAHVSALKTIEQLRFETHWAFADEYGDTILALISAAHPPPPRPPTPVPQSILGDISNTAVKPRAVTLRQCSACGDPSHIRTNRKCPKYQQADKENVP